VSLIKTDLLPNNYVFSLGKTNKEPILSPSFCHDQSERSPHMASSPSQLIPVLYAYMKYKWSK